MTEAEKYNRITKMTNLISMIKISSDMLLISRPEYEDVNLKIIECISDYSVELMGYIGDLELEALKQL